MDYKNDSYKIYFNCYTAIIQELKLLNFETANNSGLLFESEKDLYFLIIISFLDIPKYTEKVLNTNIEITPDTIEKIIKIDSLIRLETKKVIGKIS